MKSVLLFFMFLSCSVGLAKETKEVPREPAAASQFKELSSDVVRVLDTLYTSCPEKLSEVMQGANAFGKVWYREVNRPLDQPTEWTWKITTVNRQPFPAMGETTVATLTISWKSKPEKIPAADRGTEWEKSCSIQKN